MPENLSPLPAMSSIRHVFLLATWCMFAMACLHATTASAQLQSRQNFAVTVPSNLSITAPPNVGMMHNQTDANQTFPLQRWRVVGNSIRGVTVSFSTDGPFVHNTDTTSQRDVQLGLSIASSSGVGRWILTQAIDSTDYANRDSYATVSAMSNGTATATFDLQVSFLTDTYGSFPAGLYETTVTGTITAN
ncbi:hypothetical protein [Rhodopirellula sp. SWK7]|uniref:hypothetical protein n=1 Tax=Rhodopirellula sp. SWK7 TaxID=595460 RepID=UPI0002BD7648|nr:hypothetical protein [Rhodopirellula sp. SWK7]EMI46400.1 putative secreted protein [Rhodopirellula sp. SWK7]